MSEQKTNLQMIYEAREGLVDAVQYGEEAHAIQDSKIMEIGYVASANLRDDRTEIDIHHGPLGTEVSVEDITKDSGASKQGNYKARLGAGYSIAAAGTVASVERDGYGKHEFGRDKRVKAANLIASLAAKRLASAADEKVERMNKAQEKYRAKSNK